MASGDTKIRFTVEGISQLHQEFQKILTDSQSLTKEWENQGSSIISSLKEQLSLLKQRNSIASPTNIGSSGIQGTNGQGLNISPDIENALESIVSDGVMIKSSSLKELAELLRGTTPVGGDNTQSNPSGASNSPKSDDSDTKGGISQNDFTKFVKNFVFTNLLNTIQTNDPMKAIFGMGGNLGSSLMMTGNPYAVAGGVALSAISKVFDARYQALSEVAPVGAEASRLLGGSWKDYSTRMFDYEKYGMSTSDVVQRRMALARSMGRQNLGTNLDDALLWEKTTSLSSQDIDSLARSARGESYFNVNNSLSLLVSSLNRSGISNEKIQTQMSEYLREIVSLNQIQVQQFGRSDSAFNTGLFAMLSSVLPKTAEASPEFLGRISQSFYQGFSNPQSEQMRALRYASALRSNPNAGWFDLKMMMEDPLGMAEGISDSESIRRRQATQDYLSMQKGAGGDWQGFAEILRREYGLSYNVAGTLAQSDKIDFNKFFEEVKKAQDTTNEKAKLQEELPDKVDSISRILAEWKNLKLGENIESICTMVESIDKILEKDGIVDTSSDIYRSIKKFNPGNVGGNAVASFLLGLIAKSAQ